MKKRLSFVFNLFAVVLLAFALYLNFIKKESNTAPLAPAQKQDAPQNAVNNNVDNGLSKKG